ncbi:hypothetical protein BC936DRAFT_148398 [Jimgerdemannia flammicorona]|uniref:Uncharacterized protein n=1 Tax=Jimgerdemannia flammicorona TaxID=994334 RepID=A0A433D343_9FUNG|nr:hypothetical protein BC936DRAFT_148398 [Jimgerdemannia flammicorona]
MHAPKKTLSLIIVSSCYFLALLSNVNAYGELGESPVSSLWEIRSARSKANVYVTARPIGHILTAQVAQKFLSPETRKAVANILPKATGGQLDR